MTKIMVLVSGVILAQYDFSAVPRQQEQAQQNFNDTMRGMQQRSMDDMARQTESRTVQCDRIGTIVTCREY